MFENILTKEMYLEIIHSQVVTFGLNWYGTNCFFIQDNDPKHTSNLCSNINQINWILNKPFLKSKIYTNYASKKIRIPPFSPELNPIVLMWVDLNKYVVSRMSGSIYETKVAINE